MARLFGTDGVRGVANGPLLTAELALGLGRASARFARERGARRTPAARPDRARHAPLGLHARGRAGAGVASAGGLAVRVGVLPTPGHRRRSSGSGTPTSASSSRRRTTRSPTTASSSSAATGSSSTTPTRIASSSSSSDGRAADGRRRSARSSSLPDAADALRRLGRRGRRRAADGRARILVDCANGAASVVASRLFEGLGIERRSLLREPDGAQHQRALRLDPPRRAQRARRRRRLRARPRVRRRRRPRARGRLPQGTVVDGDQIVAILARDLHARRSRCPATWSS